jgi:hypothetical protein
MYNTLQFLSIDVHTCKCMCAHTQTHTLSTEWPQHNTLWSRNRDSQAAGPALGQLDRFDAIGSHAYGGFAH